MVVEWETFESDDFSHYAVNEVESERINWRDHNDEYLNKDGSEKTRQVVTLKGRG